MRHGPYAPTRDITEDESARVKRYLRDNPDGPFAEALSLAWPCESDEVLAETEEDDPICLCDAVAPDRRPYKHCPFHGTNTPTN